MEQGNPQSEHDGQADEHDGKLSRDGRAEPLDVHRFVVDRIRDGRPVTVAALVAEWFGLPASAAWVAPWRRIVVAAVDALAERDRVGWVSVDGEPAVVLAGPAELGDPGPAAAANGPKDARQSPPKPISGPPPRPVAPGPSGGAREARQRRVRLAGDRTRGVVDVQLPS